MNDLEFFVEIDRVKVGGTIVNPLNYFELVEWICLKNEMESLLFSREILNKQKLVEANLKNKKWIRFIGFENYFIYVLEFKDKFKDSNKMNYITVFYLKKEKEFIVTID